jgi:tRNA A37 N6-isopentenylltransferase MiaA
LPLDQAEAVVLECERDWLAGRIDQRFDQMLAQGEGTFLDRTRRLAEETDSRHVREITDFILAASDRSFLTPK